nr:hypothetical protein [Tanacetum cinerariifolium]
QYKPEDIQELIQKLFTDVQNIHEELAEYINTLSWNRPAFYNYDDDDDEDYTIAITPEEPVDSLIMEDMQELIQKLFNDVQNIHEELDEYINILSWNRPAFYNDDDDDDEDYTIAITPVLPTEEPDNSLRFLRFNDDSTLIDNDYFSVDDINYVEASPPDSEFVSLEEVEDDILHEKLLNIHILIDKIESLNDNSTPNRVFKSPSLFPIPVKDSDSFFEKSDTSLSYLDNSLPEFETFSDHTEETSCGSTTTHDDNSLPDTTTHIDNSLPGYDSFLFKIEPDQGELTSVVIEDILGEPHVYVPMYYPPIPPFCWIQTSLLLMIPWIRS